MTKKKEQTSPAWGGARPGTGRKPKPEESKAQPVTLSLPPGLITWLDSLGPNRSATVTKLLQASREYLAQE